MFTDLAKKWFLGVFTACTIAGIAAAFGAYADVQVIKPKMEKMGATVGTLEDTVHKNHGMICEIAIINKVPEDKIIKFCVK